MTILVTGADGHLGSNLVRALVARGETVRAFSNRESTALAELPVEKIIGDVRDADAVGAAAKGADIVFHLAAMISIDGSHGGLVRQINVEGTRNVAEAALAAGARRMVHCSSIHAYAQTPLDQPLDETREKVAGPGHPAYDLSKAAGEAEVRKVIAKGLDAVIVNPTALLGPCDFGPSRMGQVLIDLYRRKAKALVVGGFDWVDARDVASGVLAASERGRTGENYLLSGHWLSMADLAAIASKISGVPAPRMRAPMWLARMAAPLAGAYARGMRREPLFTSEALAALRGNRDVRRAKAEAELGYRSRPIEETVADTYRWFAEARLIDTNHRLKGLANAT